MLPFLCMRARVTSYVRSHAWLMLLLGISILVRLPYLGSAFLLRGERDIVLTGLSLLKTGKDLYSVAHPLQFFGLDQPSPFLSFYVSALAWMSIPIKTVFTARLPFMLMASLNTLLVYELIYTCTQKKNLSLLTTAIYVLSPGYFHLSMLALEMNVAFPLLLGGMVTYMRNKKVVGWLLLMLSFMSYNGFRPLIPFLVMYLEVWHWMRHGSIKKLAKQATIAVLVFCALFAGTYLWIDGDIMRSRGADLAFINYEDIIPQVNFRRTTTTAPVQLARIVDNKITETSRYLMHVFYEGQSLHYLFFKGDQAALYATTFTGQFFVIFLVAYYAGFVALGVRKEARYWYIMGFIPIALIPSMINVDYISVAIRSMLVSVSYAFLFALGIELMYEHLQKLDVRVRRGVIACVAVLFCIEIGYFTYNYTYRRPVTMYESYFEHERQIAHYMQAHPGISIYDTSPKNVLTAYTLLEPSASIVQLQSFLTASKQGSMPHTFGSFHIYPCPQSGKKEVMYKPGTLIADSCLDPDEYQALEYSDLSHRMNYKDFSGRTAYFIYQNPQHLPTRK